MLMQSWFGAVVFLILLVRVTMVSTVSNMFKFLEEKIDNLYQYSTTIFMMLHGLPQVNNSL